MVMTGGMLPQQRDALELIEMCRAHGKPVVVGGPDVTSSPARLSPAPISRFCGEAEAVIDDFIAAWEGGAREGVFEAPKFTVDVTKTPIPRFDLLKFDALPLHRRAVLARLPVHLRVLRHHRALRPRAAHQDHAQMLAELDRSTSSAIAATSTSSTTTSSATRSA